MHLRKKTDTGLFLFTSEFPCGHGEPFLNSELPYIAASIKKVFVIPIRFSAQVTHLPENVKLLNHNDFKSKKSKWQFFISYFFPLITMCLNDLFFSSNRKKFIRHFREYLSYLLHCIELAERIESLLETNQITSHQIAYSYWMNEWAMALSILKNRKKIDKFIFRVHGFDVFDEQTRHTYIPFVPFIISKCDKVFSVSNKGAQYLKLKVNKKDAAKVTCSYLGTETEVEKFSLKKANDKIYTLVSCAKIRSIKRIHLIAEILKYIDFPVRWIHLGGYAEENYKLKVDSALVELAQIRPEIRVDFKGDLSNEAIMDFYKENYCNLFISLSLTEGLPFSMMEAISFGIPLLATDVGGCSEIVTPQTGMLIPKDFNPQEVAEKMTTFKDSKLQTPEYRIGVRQFWEENFNAKVNYRKFVEEILKI